LRKSEVKWLVRLLEIEPKKLVAPASFDLRLKVQKAVFLLHHLKASPFTDYLFSLYLHGPYCPDLAKDYYGLEKVRAKKVRLDQKHLETLRWFVSNDERWLEVASSIISIKDRYADVTRERIFSTLTLSKPWVSEDVFESVMSDLERKEL
jgi:uncharacterized protein YwgA